MDPKDRVEAAVKTKVGAKRERTSDAAPSPDAGARITRAQMDAIVEDWPSAPKMIALEMVERYGLPDEASATLLIWHDSGQFKRTIVTSDETAHNFPTPHTDYITQTINYRVPVHKLPELAEFDGSLIVYRTAGQVSSSCDNEASNLLAFNLMHDIVEGRRTVAEARQELGEQNAAWLMNRPAPYTERLHFRVPNEAETGHLDEPVMKGPALRQAAGKVKDVLTGETG